MLGSGWRVFRIDTRGFAIVMLSASVEEQDVSSFLFNTKADHAAVIAYIPSKN
jgi:hypothetical protein